jgi:hypothetical protein
MQGMILNMHKLNLQVLRARFQATQEVSCNDEATLEDLQTQGGSCRMPLTVPRQVCYTSPAGWLSYRHDDRLLVHVVLANCSADVSKAKETGKSADPQKVRLC